VKHDERPARPRARDKRDDSERVFGLAAARAAFQARPEAVLSVAHTESQRHALAGLLKEAARRRIAYREVDVEELTRMAQSVHHEGVCLRVRPRPAPDVTELLKGLGERGLLLALDGVQNPHNIGAILRSAAYFGARGLVYTTPAEPGAASLSAAARRVAEGGAEYVPALGLPSLAGLLREARRLGVAIVGSDARAQATSADYAWPARSLLVLGHEHSGMTRAVREQCDSLLRIDGAGAEHIDSLNVSVAAGIFLASYTGARGARR
jgi:TrmH RNA methyltransferase